MPSLALSTGSLHNYGLNRVWHFAAEAGFDAVELMVAASWDTRQPAYLWRLMGETGLPVVALHTPFRPVAGFGDDYPERVRRALALAGEIGAGVVVAHPEVERGGDVADYGSWLRKHYEELSPAGGPRLAVENLPLVVRGRKPRFKHHTVERVVAFPCLTFDTTHFGTTGVDLPAAWEALGERVAHVHLSDYRDGNEHLLPGAGALPLGPFLAALSAAGYAGAVSVEVRPDALGAGDDAEVQTRLRAVVAFCREHWRAAKMT